MYRPDTSPDGNGVPLLCVCVCVCVCVCGQHHQPWGTDPPAAGKHPGWSRLCNAGLFSL